MKKVISFLTLVSLMSSSALSTVACINNKDNDDNNKSYYSQEISEAIIKSKYSLNIKTGITKSYLIEQISSNYIKSLLPVDLQSKFRSNLLQISDVINTNTKLSITNKTLSIENQVINAAIKFTYYKVYDQITTLNLNIGSFADIIDINNIDDINISIPFKFKVLRINSVQKEYIEKIIFPVLSNEFIAAVNKQTHIFIEKNTDFTLSSNILPIEDFSTSLTKDIIFTITTNPQSKKIKNRLAITIKIEAFQKVIDLDDFDYSQSVYMEVALNHETYNNIKTRISEQIYQAIEKLDNTADENEDYRILFKNAKKAIINLDDVVERQQTIFLSIKAITGENKPFVNEKDIGSVSKMSISNYFLT